MIARASKKPQRKAGFNAYLGQLVKDEVPWEVSAERALRRMMGNLATATAAQSRFLTEEERQNDMLARMFPYIASPARVMRGIPPLEKPKRQKKQSYHPPASSLDSTASLLSHYPFSVSTDSIGHAIPSVDAGFSVDTESSAPSKADPTSKLPREVAKVAMRLQGIPQRTSVVESVQQGGEETASLWVPSLSSTLSGSSKGSRGLKLKPLAGTAAKANSKQPPSAAPQRGSRKATAKPSRTRSQGRLRSRKGSAKASAQVKAPAGGGMADVGVSPRRVDPHLIGGYLFSSDSAFRGSKKRRQLVPEAGWELFHSGTAPLLADKMDTMYSSMASLGGFSALMLEESYQHFLDGELRDTLRPLSPIKAGFDASDAAGGDVEDGDDEESSDSDLSVDFDRYDLNNDDDDDTFEREARRQRIMRMGQKSFAQDVAPQRSISDRLKSINQSEGGSSEWRTGAKLQRRDVVSKALLKSIGIPPALEAVDNLEVAFEGSDPLKEYTAPEVEAAIARYHPHEAEILGKVANRAAALSVALLRWYQVGGTAWRFILRSVSWLCDGHSSTCTLLMTGLQCPPSVLYSLSFTLCLLSVNVFPSLSLSMLCCHSPWAKWCAAFARTISMTALS